VGQASVLEQSRQIEPATGLESIGKSSWRKAGKQPVTSLYPAEMSPSRLSVNSSCSKSVCVNNHS
jgi:hypothetical protein